MWGHEGRQKKCGKDFLRPSSHHSLDVGLLLLAATPGLRRGVAPPSHHPWLRTQGGSCQPPPLTSDMEWLLSAALSAPVTAAKSSQAGSQETPGVTGKFGLGIRNEAGQTNRKCTDHRKHPLPTTQEKTLHMDITRWSTPKSD